MPPKKTSSAAAAASKPATRTTRAASAKTAAAAPAKTSTSTTTAKTNGKKRAAADAADEDATASAKSSAAAGKKPRTKKAAAAAPVAEEEEDVEEEDAGDVNEREILASLSDVSVDSSDEEADEEDEGANSSDEDDEDDRLASSAAAQPRSSLASMKLPNSKDDAVVKARLDKLRKSKSSSAASTTPGVLYIGRLPKGFFEKQLKAYFSQFGDVTRLRVSRNKKTGASKHYAFIEFADQDVAKIVQETMHNYLIDGRLLQVKQVSKDQIHPELWIGANRKFNKVPGDRIERVVRSRAKTDEEQQRTNERALKRQDDRRTKLHKLGIDYDFPGYTTSQENSTPPATAKKATPASAKKVSAKAKTAKA